MVSQCVPRTPYPSISALQPQFLRVGVPLRDFVAKRALQMASRLSGTARSEGVRTDSGDCALEPGLRNTGERKCGVFLVGTDPCF